jgi:hypothetical protein
MIKHLVHDFSLEYWLLSLTPDLQGYTCLYAYILGTKCFDVWIMVLQRKRAWSDEGIKGLDDFIIQAGYLWQVQVLEE